MKSFALLLLFCTFLFSAEKIICVGSTTIQPVIEQLIQNYKDETGMLLVVEGGGSQVGIDSLSSKKADIAMVSRELSEEEKQKFSYITIGYDALAIIVNSANPLTNISTKNLIEIYKGNIKNWKALGVNDKNIHLISKKADRGTMHIFEHYTKLFNPNNPKNTDKTKMISDKAWEAGADTDGVVWVGGLTSAIGFVSFGSTENAKNYGMPIKILSLDNKTISAQAILNKTYPIIRELNLVFMPQNIKAKKFANWMKEDLGQMMLEQNMFVGASK